MSIRRTLLLGTILALVACLVATRPDAPAGAQTANPCEPWPICKINHIVVIMQENRSFDHYFGTYASPSGMNVEGLPTKQDGTFAVCIPDPALRHCVKPYHSTNLYNVGAPHSHAASEAAVNRGQMNGFVRVGLWNDRTGFCIRYPNKGECSALTGPSNQPDIMSFHTRDEIPNYWAYADYGALQDHMFEPVDSWSLPAHLYLVSGWAANCTDDFDASTCTSSPTTKKAWNYPWADITILLRDADVSWNYYVGDATNLSCMGKPPPVPRTPCNPGQDPNASSDGWLPILWFQSLAEANDKGRVQHLSDFYDSIQASRLANVVWFIPSGANSEHPGHAAIRPGERYVTSVVNAIGRSPHWDDTAIFITWDDWGGFYDHVPPVQVDGMGYGIRVPGIMISPYAKESFVDQQTLSFDAYLKFIEDRFLGGARLDPETDGWWDPRPTVREDIPELGDLALEFDFNQAPRPAPILTEPPLRGPAEWPYPRTRQVGFGDG